MKEQKRVYDGSITLEQTQDKYIFWDIDGTLAPFRFNDHVSDPMGTHFAMSLQEIEEGCFRYRRPSKHMQRVLETCKAKKHLILGHCHEQKEIEDKHGWLDEYFPYIKERFLVADEVEKYQVILEYCEENHILLKNVLFVDDSHGILKQAEKHGIKAYHISSFLDWFEQQVE